MRPISLTLMLVLGYLCSQGSSQLKKSEIWVTRDIKWDKAPAEYNPDLSTGSATILFFKPDGKFGMMHCRLNKGPRYIVVSLGDGQTVYEGSWVADGDKIKVRYRLTFRSVSPVGGEILPGPEASSVVQILRAKGGQSAAQITMGDHLFVPVDDKQLGRDIVKEFFRFQKPNPPVKK